MKKILAVVAVSLLVANCSATTQTTSVQIGGHPFKTTADCQRIKPIGTFDPKCDHPRLGYGDFSDPTIRTQTGAPGGLGGF
jgi:heat shock protein HslJ